MKNKKKYGLGTRQYLETPSEAMTENDIAMAKAKYEAETDPWVLGLELMGGMAMDYGLSMAGSSGAPTDDTPIGKSKGLDLNMGQNTDLNIPTTMKDSFLGAISTKVVANGATNIGGNIEAEGGEIVETPDGEVSKLKGNKHEQGGQDISIPDGTNIFSDRIFIKGKSIADRKEARTKKQTKIEKLLSKKPTDKLLKNSYEKSMSNFEKEEEKDLQVQDMIGFIAGSRGEAMFGLNKSFGLTDVMDNLTMPDKAAFGFNSDSPDTNSFGNLVGVAGNLVSGFGPLFNTLKERATDTPNIDPYEGYGQDALDTIDESKGYIAGQRENALKDIARAGRESKAQNRNTARGVNTMRALDLSVDQNMNTATENTYDSFAKNMMSILGKKADTELDVSGKRLEGKAIQDLNDRKDKGAYYSNLGKDIGTVGTSLQQTGKDLNVQKQQDAINKILAQLSDYGITFDKDYNLKNPE